MRVSRRALMLTVGAASLMGGRFRVAHAGAPAHAISIYGDVKYGPDFRHFDYVRPDAPKGGTLAQGAIGSFDSFNPFILRGLPAAGIGQLFETLLTSSLDEPFTEYGLLAKSVETPEDRSWVAFELNPDARWHDGKPVTAEDVVFSFETLTTKAHPRYRYYYGSVLKAEVTGPGKVTFTFKPGETNRELPLIMGQLPIMPKHHYEKVDFDRPSLDLPLGSGPYKVERFDAGRSIVYSRVPDYWGAKLPVNTGRNNFDQVRYEYFRDLDVSLEAFKAGQYDLRFENSAKRWATGYTGPAIEKGLIKVEKLPIRPPARMQGYIFNLRRPVFVDIKVRQAIGYAFDFEWSNKALMYDQYTRLKSYFDGEPTLMATGLPEGPELALLEPFRAQLPAALFTTAWAPPVTDGSGNPRDNLREGLRLLREAGFALKDGVMTHKDTGQKLEFEYLSDQANDERLATPFAQNLEKIGVRMRIRIVDQAQYQNRTDAFDFDVVTDLWGQSSSPGNEQRDFWGSAAAATPGSRNTIGIKDPVIDALIEKVVQAPDRPSLEVACRALDRVLLWGFCLVPHFTDNGYRAAYWDKFGRPATLPTKGPDIYAWWVESAKDRALQPGREQIQKNDG